MDLVHIAYSHFLFPNTDFFLITSLVKLNIICPKEAFLDPKIYIRFPSHAGNIILYFFITFVMFVVIQIRILSFLLASTREKPRFLSLPLHPSTLGVFPGPEKVLNKSFFKVQKIINT